MIAFLEGHVLFLEPGFVVLKAYGVGYQVMLNKKDLEFLRLEQEIALHIHTNIREDAFELYGFLNRQDKQIFQALISVSGVGPKLALGISSSMPSQELAEALMRKDLLKLSSIPGIGKKTAERLCLELKDKILKLDLAFTSSLSEPSVRMNLAHAIRDLGYTKDQSDKAVLALEPHELDSLPLEILLKKTLAYLSGKVS